MKSFFAALLVSPVTILGLLGAFALIDPQAPSKHGPAYDHILAKLWWSGGVMAAVTVWLWLNTYFKFTKTPVLDGVLAILVPGCMTIHIAMDIRLAYFPYSGDDGWFSVLGLYISCFLFLLFGWGFGIILHQRYFAKESPEKISIPLNH